MRKGGFIIGAQFGLFRTRRFLPLFLTQFFGAFNDNLFKSALVILITFRLADVYNMDSQVLITIVAGLFILPFFLFSATAGQLADKYEKTFLIRRTKAAEFFLMVMTAFAFMTTSLWLLIILLFFMGAQSAFFGPLKYSILPQHLREEELIAGNGLVSAGTYIAILLGTLCGGLLILSEWGRIYISFGVVAVAVVGYVTSLFIPRAEAFSPDIKIETNIPKAIWQLFSFVYPYRTIFRSILGISWFWLIGSVFLSQFPSFAKNTLGGNEQVSTLFLIFFSIGVGLGSVLCDGLLGGKISAKLVPFGCVGMSAAIAILYVFCARAGRSEHLLGIIEFASMRSSWWIMLALVMLAASGGIFSVPLYAIIQSQSPLEHRARVVACTNMADSLGMVLGAIFTTLLLLLHVSIINIFLVMGLINLIITPLLARIVNGRDDCFNND